MVIMRSSPSLAMACDGRRTVAQRRHGRRRARSVAPALPPSSSIGVVWSVDHDGMSGLIGDLTVSEISPVDRRTLHRVIDRWTPLTRGPPLSANVY